MNVLDYRFNGIAMRRSIAHLSQAQQDMSVTDQQRLVEASTPEECFIAQAHLGGHMAGIEAARRFLDKRRPQERVWEIQKHTRQLKTVKDDPQQIEARIKCETALQHIDIVVGIYQRTEREKNQLAVTRLQTRSEDLNRLRRAERLYI